MRASGRRFGRCGRGWDFGDGSERHRGACWLGRLDEVASACARFTGTVNALGYHDSTQFRLRLDSGNMGEIVERKVGSQMVLAPLIRFGIGDPRGVRLLDKGSAVRLLFELRRQSTRSVGVWCVLCRVWA